VGKQNHGIFVIYRFFVFCFLLVFVGFLLCCLCVVGCIGLRRLQIAGCTVSPVIKDSAARAQAPDLLNGKARKAPVGQPFPALTQQRLVFVRRCRRGRLGT